MTARQRTRPATRAAASEAGPARPDGRQTAAIVGASLGMQAVAWVYLWLVFGIARAGYWFFDITDLGYYWQLSQRIWQGQTPFRDFFIEYPPLFAPLLYLPGRGLDALPYVERFALVMVVLMALAGAVTAIAAFDPARPRRAYVVAALFAGFTLLLGPIAANLYDPLVALLLAATVLFMVYRRWTLAAVALGIGFAAKITPIMLLPVLFLIADRKRYLAMAGGFAAAAVIPFVWVLALGGQAAGSLSQMFAYHLSRPLEIESVLATPLWFGRLFGGIPAIVATKAGSQVIVSGTADVLAKLSTIVLVVALGAVFALIWRRRAVIASEPSYLFLAVLATLLASLVGSKVLSPQYFVWVVPAVALVAIDRRWLGVLVGVALLLTHVLFPANYWAFANGQVQSAIAIVVIRNLVLVAAFALSLWHLWTLPAEGTR